MTNPLGDHTRQTAAYVALHWIKAAGIAYETGNLTDYRQLLQNIDPGATPMILMTVLPGFFRYCGVYPPGYRPESPETDQKDGGEHE